MRPTSPSSLFALLISLCGVGLAGGAQATMTTLTFESGAGHYDPDHPGGGLHGPYDWIEGGARYAGFWLTDVGTPSAGTEIAHTHLGGFGNGAPQIGDFQHSWRGDLQGSLVSILDGRSFDIVSIDFILTRRAPEAGVSYSQQVLPWSFPASDIQLLIGTDITGVAPDFATFESQFTAYDADDGSHFDLGGGLFDPERPAGGAYAGTIFPTDFTNITSFYLAHTGARMVIDTIVLDVHDPVGAVVPEPRTALLLGLGLGCIARRPRTA